MDRIYDDFWQNNNSAIPPFIQLGQITVHLGTGDILDDDGRFKGTLSVPQLMLLLLLLHRALTSPYSYCSATYLAENLYSQEYNDHNDAEHAVEQHIHNLRNKLDKEMGKHFIIVSRGRGYRLHLPEGCCSIPARVVWSLLQMLKYR